MAKITIQRIFETTKALATEAGQSLQDFINFNAQFAELTLRSLRNGITYSDNFDCEIKKISISHNVNLNIPTDVSRRPTEVRVRRVLDVTSSLARPLSWGFSENGKVFVRAFFDPVPTSPVNIEIIVLY
jgi:hypothetical protein